MSSLPGTRQESQVLSSSHWNEAVEIIKVKEGKLKRYHFEVENGMLMARTFTFMLLQNMAGLEPAMSLQVFSTFSKHGRKLC